MIVKSKNSWWIDIRGNKHRLGGILYFNTKYIISVNEIKDGLYIIKLNNQKPFIIEQNEKLKKFLEGI